VHLHTKQHSNCGTFEDLHIPMLSVCEFYLQIMFPFQASLVLVEQEQNDENMEPCLFKM